MRKLLLGLGAALLILCSVALFCDRAAPGKSPIELSCQQPFCDGAPLARRTQQAPQSSANGNVQTPVDDLRVLLQREPHNPTRWADLGEAFLNHGEKPNARYCFGKAVDLAPRSPALLLRVAGDYFTSGEARAGLALTATVLVLTSQYDTPIFGQYKRMDNFADVLQYGLIDGRSSNAWFDEVVSGGRVDTVERTWEWIVDRGEASDESLARCLAFCIRQGQIGFAADAWRKYVGRQGFGSRQTGLMFNGDFEFQPVLGPFDWTIANIRGVETVRDCTVAASGKCSLRLSFDGTENIDAVMASQSVAVEPGIYHLHMFVRSADLSTDHGVQFRVSDAESPARLNLIVGQSGGTHAWQEVDYRVIVPPQTRLLHLQVIRQASLKFDSMIAGTAWVDRVTLEPDRGR